MHPDLKHNYVSKLAAFYTEAEQTYLDLKRLVSIFLT